MRRPLKQINRFLDRGAESGQAMVEYILMIVVALSFIAIMGSSFRKSVIKLWGFYIQQISAAGPGCTPNPDYKFR